MKAVFDTNVLVSAFEFGGIPYELFKRGISGKFELVTSAAILLEMATVLHDKFDWIPSDIQDQIALVYKVAKVIRPLTKVNVSKDETDNKILECAIDGNADYVITGDKKHLLSLKKFEGIKIISPAQFFKEVLYKLGD